MKPQDENISREMINAFMEDMTPAQLDKLCTYACMVLSDKRYKKIKNGKKEIKPSEL
jgi:hypothetical protein